MGWPILALGGLCSGVWSLFPGRVGAWPSEGAEPLSTSHWRREDSPVPGTDSPSWRQRGSPGCKHMRTPLTTYAPHSHKPAHHTRHSLPAIPRVPKTRSRAIAKTEKARSRERCRSQVCAGRRRANHNPSRASVNTRPSASAWRRRLQRRAGKKQLTGGLRGRGGGAVLCSFGDDAALARCCERSIADLLLTLGCFLEGSCGLLRKGRGKGK